ncbi:MAG: hypothetical protein ACJ8ER_03115 [Allosphingosinicella sp.]
MSLSQAKIDLAVLYKLHQHAEAGGGEITPADVMRLFNVKVSLRRVELALAELYAKGDIEREYHPFYSEEGLWQISRDGMARVDRALKVPTSFIARLHANRDAWLDSEEASKAVLKKLSSGETDFPPEPIRPVILPSKSLQAGSKAGGHDWGKHQALAAWMAVIVALLGILVTWLVQG